LYFDSDLGETISEILPYDRNEMLASIVKAVKNGELDSAELETRLTTFNEDYGLNLTPEQITNMALVDLPNMMLPSAEIAQILSDKGLLENTRLTES
jgi:uncharacterized protein YpuA (DUF1002 family)